MKEIGEKVFSDCSKLTNLTLGSGIEKVGSEAFANCSALKSVSVPGSVKEIGDYAFLRLWQSGERGADQRPGNRSERARFTATTR